MTNPMMARILAILLLALGAMSAVTVRPATGADTTSPSAPGHLTVLGGATQITLLWNASLDDVGVSGYRVERCQGAGCASFSQIAAPAATAFVDSALSAGATYRYRVRAADAAGNLSAYSKVVTAVAGSSGPGLPGGGGSGTDTRPPKPPRSVTATAAGTSITLRWSPATDNVGVTGYIIQRCQGAGCTGFGRIASIGPQTSFLDAGLASNTTYQYRVRAADAGSNVSLPSRVASAKTQGSGNPPPPPPPPPGQALSPRAVALTFSQTQQFTTSLSGETWSVDGVAGGSEAVGTISTNGLYSAPDAVGTHTVRATAGGQSATAVVHITNYSGKFTHHNDNLRTGQNQSETVLTLSNVSSSTFGKLFSYPLDGVSHASPLYVANVTVPGRGVRNVVYVATEHNSVYAFDADGRQSDPLWHVSFIDPDNGITPVPPGDTQENGDIAPEIGITGTPVIDAQSRTLYVVAKTKEVANGQINYVQRLHALNIATGAEKFGGPVEIEARVPGLGTGTSGGQVAFLPLRHNQRAALLLSRGVVYVAFGSHGDAPPYHGWVMGYDANTLQQTMVWNATPNGEGGGVWQSGGGIAADTAGNLFFATGDGSFDANAGGDSYGDSFVKLSPTGDVLDFFTPFDQAEINRSDADLGAGGLMLLPPQGGSAPSLLVEAGKNGSMYLVDRNDMGRYNPNNNNQIVQSLQNIFNAAPDLANYSTPVYHRGTVYFSPVSDFIKAFQLTNGVELVGPTSLSAETYSFPGASLSISANGNSNGILWAIQNGGSGQGVLRAYDATNLNNVLYGSNENGSRDSMGIAAKYSTALIANGKVFVTGSTQLTVFGLLP